MTVREIAIARELRVGGALATGRGIASAHALIYADNLVSHWKLNEVSGIRYDSYGSNHLTDNNTVGYGTGVIDGAADFVVGNAEYLSCVSDVGLVGGNRDFTFTGWIYIVNKAVLSGRHAITKGTANTVAGIEYRFLFDGPSDRYEWFVSNGVNTTTVSANSLGSPTENTWYFFVIDHNRGSNTISVQFNNGTIDSAAHTYGCQSTAGPLLIGSRPGTPGVYWDGMMDSLTRWNRLLNSRERTELYNLGRGRDFPFMPA